MSRTIFVFCALSIAMSHAWVDNCTSPLTEGTGATLYLMKEAAQSDNAVCLDGTPGGYYFQPGSGSGANKWYIHHQGGGWCESLDDCLGRSQGALGTSKNDPAEMALGGGYFSDDEKENPLMYNWNKVFMRYCDGGSFSGSNDKATTYKGHTLHWRGSHVRQGMATDLFSKRGLDKASDLVVSGCSAGGLATYLHTDQWCDELHANNPSAKCVGLPDSGFFLDYQDPHVTCTPTSPRSVSEVQPLKENGRQLLKTIDGDYHCGLKWTYTVQNATSGINKDCVEAHQSTGDTWKCMFAEHSADYIRAPVFAMQSAYDAWQTGNVQGRATTQELGNNITSRIKSDLMAHNKESGAFLDSCHHHCGSWNSIRIDGDLVSVAVQKWYEGIGKGGKKLWNQDKPYPCDACCKP